jgi:hypothetical protein
MSGIEHSIQTVKRAWIGSPYYKNAEKLTSIFWAPQSNFRRLFEQLDVTRCAELACGHGRHAEQLLREKGAQVELLYCLDVIQDNIDVTAKRLQAFTQVQTILTSGSDFQPIASGSLTSIYCYDAMVHFSQNPHARNHMTLPLFVSFASAAGLHILETSALDWGGIRNLDRISVLERP